MARNGWLAYVSVSGTRPPRPIVSPSNDSSALFQTGLCDQTTYAYHFPGFSFVVETDELVEKAEVKPAADCCYLDVLHPAIFFWRRTPIFYTGFRWSMPDKGVQYVSVRDSNLSC